MRLVIGTDRGIYDVADSAGGGADATRVLDGPGVLVLAAVDGQVLAGTESGIWISDDGGAGWSCAGIADREVWAVRSTGDGTIFAGSAPPGLFRSTDRGTTWEEVESFVALPEAEHWGVAIDPAPPARARTIDIDPRDPRRVRVGIEVGGLVASDDGGETWGVTLPGGSPDLHVLLHDPADPATWYVSTGYGRFDHSAPKVDGNAGVFRTDDGGRTWSYAWSGVTPRYSRPMCIDPRPPHGLTVGAAPLYNSRFDDPGGAQARLFRSEDGGRSWRSLGDPAHDPSDANFHGLAVDPDRPGGVIVGTDTGEVWRVGADRTWELIVDGLPEVWSVLPTPSG